VWIPAASLTRLKFSSSMAAISAFAADAISVSYPREQRARYWRRACSCAPG
jgi:hypothetical protein